MQKIGIAAGRPSEALFVADDAKVKPGLVRPNGPRKAVKNRARDQPLDHTGRLALQERVFVEIETEGQTDGNDDLRLPRVLSQAFDRYCVRHRY